MIGSVSNGYTTPSKIASIGSSTSAISSKSFSLPLPTATADTSAISPQAAAKAAVANFDFSYSNMDHSQADFAAHYAEGAHNVSASQGLPDGQYDFTNMSSRQLRIVINDATLNKNAGSSLEGLSETMACYEHSTPYLPDQPHNILAEMTTSANYERETGYSASAAMFDLSIAYAKSVQASTNSDTDRSSFDALTGAGRYGVSQG